MTISFFALWIYPTLETLLAAFPLVTYLNSSNSNSAKTATKRPFCYEGSSQLTCQMGCRGQRECKVLIVRDKSGRVGAWRG